MKPRVYFYVRYTSIFRIFYNCHHDRIYEGMITTNQFPFTCIICVYYTYFDSGARVPMERGKKKCVHVKWKQNRRKVSFRFREQVDFLWRRLSVRSVCFGRIRNSVTRRNTNIMIDWMLERIDPAFVLLNGDFLLTEKRLNMSFIHSLAVRCTVHCNGWTEPEYKLIANYELVAWHLHCKAAVENCEKN